MTGIRRKEVNWQWVIIEMFSSNWIPLINKGQIVL